MPTYQIYYVNVPSGTKSIMNMLLRIKVLLFVPLFLLSNAVLHAQDKQDYFKHRKTFDLCSFHRECSDCYSCGKQRYIVKVKNNTDKKIKKISYVFYSDVYNRILTKEAQLKGDVIDKQDIGLLYICVPEGSHWAISEIVYTDDSKADFVVHDRMENFIQEPDECDCND